MKRKWLALGLSMMFTFIFAATALADPQSIPNGPYLEDEQKLSVSSVMTNQQLYDKLAKLEKRSQGKMELEIAGYSNAIDYNLMEEKGYPLYVAKFGEPAPDKKSILVTTQIHGDEVLGTEAAVELMQKLISGDKKAEQILDNVTIWFMPRINPDGAMYHVDDEWYPIRHCLQEWDPAYLGLPEDTTAPWYYTESEELDYKGYDENRDYNPNLDFRISNYDASEVAGALNDKGYWYKDEEGNWHYYEGRNGSTYGGFYVTPEARIVTKVFKELDPDVYIDVHHRGFNYLSEEDKRSVSIQVAADVADPYTCPWSGKKYQVDEDVLKLAKQINAVGYQSLQRGLSHFGAIQKYPDVNLPGTSLGAFALNDTSIMLIEVKGQTDSLGQKQNGMLKQTVKESLYDILDSMADGSIHEVDPGIYDDIPESANRMRDPSW